MSYSMKSPCIWNGEQTTIGDVVRAHANASYTRHRIARAIAQGGAQCLTDVDVWLAGAYARAKEAGRWNANRSQCQIIVSGNWHFRGGAKIQRQKAEKAKRATAGSPSPGSSARTPTAGGK